LTLVLCWIVFPLVLGALAIGCGLLVRELAGGGVSGELVLPLGLAMLIVVADLAMLTGATAQLAAPGVIGFAVAGFGLARPWRHARVDAAGLTAAAAVFVTFAAPVVLSGEATFAGYIKLDDTASWLALTDRALEHGRSLDGLAPSSYEATLDFYLAGGYPLGSLLPLGIGARLVGQDVAWVFQPYLAFLAAMLALALSAIARPAIASWRLRAVAAVIAAQPALLFAYSLWGGVKEVAAAALLTLVAALVFRPGGARAALPLATACAATIAILGLGGAVWLVPALAAVVVSALRTRAFGRAAAFAALALGLSLPSLLGFAAFVRSYGAVLTSRDELGNLIEPVSPLQVAGIWPAGDFRLEPDALGPTYVLVGLVFLAAAAGLVLAWRHRSRRLLLGAATAVVGGALQATFGSPWVDAKAFATASPAVLLLAVVACMTFLERCRRIEAALPAAAIAAGVLWSNGLAYREVNLAPRDQLVELERIGQRFAGQGPALMTEYQPYGVRHFLRRLDAEGASELRRRPVLLRDGGFLGKGAFADLDQFRLDAILVYRTIVLRRSPVASRPPSIYELAWRGRYYDVWQRPDPPGSLVVEHLSLGSGIQPAARPGCREVQRLASLAGEGRLAAAERAPTIVASRAQDEVQVSRAGRYAFWLGGSFRRRLQLSVDGKVIAEARHRLNNTAQFEPLGEARLAAGRHRVALTFGGADLRPGSAGAAFGFGPLVLIRPEATDPVTYVTAEDASLLCRRDLDWIEALRG
jgi:hypothetical protein